MCMRTFAFVCAAAVAPIFIPNVRAAFPEHVRVEFLSRQSESAFKQRPTAWPLEYILDSRGDLWLTRRLSYVTDERLGRALKYSGSEHQTRYLFLYVNYPERTEFPAIMRTIERLKRIIAKHVTGNRKVVIEVLPRDWVYVNEPGEPLEAAELEPDDTSEPVAGRGSHDAPERAADEDTDAPELWDRSRQLPAPSLQIAVAALRATRRDATMKDALHFWMVTAWSYLEDRSIAPPLNSVTVEFLAKKADSTFRRGPGTSQFRYTLISWGDIWETGRGGIMTDHRLAGDLTYTGSARHVRYISLFVDSPEQTRFSDIIKAIGRLKTVIADSVTGTCKVVIEVMPPNWVFVQAPDEADCADRAATSDATDAPPESVIEPAPSGSGKADIPEGKGERGVVTNPR
jgi:hypothetical protein